MSELSAHEALCEARNRIDREGWVNHAGAGPWCAGNAINRDVNRDGLHRSACAALMDAAGLCPSSSFPHDPDPIFRWNDAPGRTKEDVLEAFDKAISATAPAPSDPLEGVDVREVVA